MKFWYCSVLLKGIERAYSYISDMGKLRIGAYVEVPFGAGNAKRIGIVDACGLYDEENAPYPVERTKHILRLASEEEYDEQSSLDPMSKDDDMFGEVNCYIENEQWDAVLQWALRHHTSDNAKVVAKVIRCYVYCLEQSMPLAALHLGSYYYRGKGVEQNYEMAFQLYQIAAVGGEVRAICNLGYCYYYGRDRAVDYEKAREYFTLGALLHSDANCLYKLGDLYRDGNGVPQNYAYASKLYFRALEEARRSEEDEVLADVYLRIGKCYLYGIGLKIDVEQAYSYLIRALEGFYERRSRDAYVSNRIDDAKTCIAEAQEVLEQDL